MDITEKRSDASSSTVRVKGKSGSEQNTLRGELYRHAIGRLNAAIENDNVFEAVALCDTLITDRLEAYTQSLLHFDELQQEVASSGWALRAVGKARKEKGIAKDAEYKQLYAEVSDFSARRNEVAHNFVIVKNANAHMSLEDRLQCARETAVLGKVVFNKLKAWTVKNIAGYHV